jgi:hypothetical protein
MTETSAQNGPLSSWCQNPEFSYFRLAVKEEQRLHELNLLLQGKKFGRGLEIKIFLQVIRNLPSKTLFMCTGGMPAHILRLAL